VASIAVYVCTHQRNEPLRRTLDSLHKAASQVQPQIEIAVVVVDDNPDGRAEPVVADHDGEFARGIHYRHSGAQNISKARNLGLTTAMELADWVAMTDDDETVAEGWFTALADVQRRTGADAVTGPVLLRHPEGSPSWLTDQPFSELLEAPTQPEGARVEVCSTGNSMLRASFLRDHPEIRFRSDLGVLGGEDMVFYRAATTAGLDARYAPEAVCWGEQPPERATYRYILGTSYWLGNTEYLTNFESGTASRPRLAVRGLRRVVEAGIRPLRRLRHGDPAQWRYAGAIAARGAGMLIGVFGIKVAHR
jgi:succinoglycan biosynthesis protein ExoM